MARRLFAFAVVSALVATQFGCSTSRCGSRHGFFSSHSREKPCQTVGRNSGCFDAATGQPVPCPPDVVPGGLPDGTYPSPVPSGDLIPGIGQPDELHMPLPSDRIQPPVPAVPLPAPPGGNVSLPYPIAPGTPVKSGQNK